MLPKVAIIYLCHGNLKHLPDVVLSLSKLNYPKENLKVFMVPNGSPDGIADVIRSEVLLRSGVDLPKIELIDDGVNRGFAGGNNSAMCLALDQGFDYIFLHNGDLKLHPDAVTEVVRIAETDSQIGSVQSLIFYWREPDVINASGCVMHMAGYGYARSNLKKLSEINLIDGSEITYASGAAVLYRASALNKVGLLEQGFFMYHEDLELGLRLRLAGYKNVLASKSLSYHDYSTTRNPKKFAWMELYRWVVMVSYYRLATLLILSPLLLAIELGTWLAAARGGWLKAKIWAYGQAFLPHTWFLIIKIRRRVKKLRVIKDQDWLKFVVGIIEAQEVSNGLMDKFANPTIDFIWKNIRKMIIW